MKYQVVELSIRKYVGDNGEKTSWIHLGHALGIKRGDKVYDYKTLKEYKFIARNKVGILNVLSKDLVEDEIYAIGENSIIFDSNKKYSKATIDEKINNCGLFTEEYKKIKRKTK